VAVFETSTTALKAIMGSVDRLSVVAVKIIQSLPNRFP